MAPIKFEEHIKEQLDKREIQPSARSWEKLNTRLENSSEKKGNLKWWIPAAAAVIVLLIMGLFFINLQKDQTHHVVENPDKENSNLPLKKMYNEVEKPIELVSETGNEKKPTEKPDKTSFRKDKNKSQGRSGIITKPVKTEGAFAQRDTNTEEFQKPLISKPFENETKKETLISEKITELLAEVIAKEEEGGDVTDAEVNALLAKAAKDVSRRQNIVSSGGVDANALLADVEDEMYESFKEKVFEALKDGYQKAAIAVSNKIEQTRNQ